MRWANGLDKIGLLLYILIVLFGIANVYSVSTDSGIKQAVWFGISLFVMMMILFVRGSVFESLAPFFYIIAVVLLVGLFPFGKEINGQRNWYVFGPISLQPVEFVKIAIALMMSSYVGNPDFSMKNGRSLLTAFAIIGIPGLLVLLQPDVGSLMVFMAFVIALYREGLSGWLFTAGFLVVTNEKAALWTDGRYFVQAAQELENTGIELMKDGIEGTPNYIDWIISQTPENGKVAVNALATSHLNWESLEQKLSARKIQLVNEPLLKDIWTDRSEPSKNEIFDKGF